MAKPIMELLPELQRAFEAMEKNQAALAVVQAAEAKKKDTAKAAYDAVLASAATAVQTASAKATESADYLSRLQAEVNAVLGRSIENSRVRTG